MKSASGSGNRPSGINLMMVECQFWPGKLWGKMLERTHSEETLASWIPNNG